MKGKRMAAAAALVALWGAAIACVTHLPACTTLDRHPAAAALVVQVATLKYIEQAPPEERAARAARVIAVADAVQIAADGTSLSIEGLAQLALERIPPTLEASDRILAVGLVNVISQELTARLGNGGLEAHSLVNLRTMLGQVKSAASFYAPRPG